MANISRWPLRAGDLLGHFRWRNVFVWLLLGLTLIPLARPYLAVGVQYAHDAEMPCIRIMALRQAYADLDLPPRWFAPFDGGYGSPYPAFYGMLFYHVATWFVLLGLSISRSIELCAFLTFVGSAIGMFCLVRRLWGDAAGLLAAVLYNYAPYHLVNAFERGAYSELSEFVWMPLVLLGLFQWFRSRSARAFSLAVAAIVGLLLTHNLVPIMFMPMACLLSLSEPAHWRPEGRSIFKRLLGFSWIFIVAGLVAAFFILPIALDRKYVRMDFFLRYKYYNYFIPWKLLLGLTRKPGLVLQAGSPQLILAVVTALIAGIHWFSRRRWPYRTLIFTSILVAWLGIYLTNPSSVIIWRKLEMIHIIQFPWRWLGLSSVGLAIAGAAVLEVLPRKLFQWIVAILLSTAVILIQLPLVKMTGSVPQLKLSEAEIRGATWLTADYRPAWSHTAYQSDNAKPSEKLPVQSQDIPTPFAGARILNHERNVNDWSFDYDAIHPGLMTLPQFYYPAWRATVDQQRVELGPATMHGLMSLQVPAGKHQVQIKYIGTTAQRLGNWISLLGIAIWIVTCVKWPRNKKIGDQQLAVIPDSVATQ